MPSVFVKQVVRQAETIYRPIAPPDDPDPTRGKWINDGLAADRDVFGQTEYE